MRIRLLKKSKGSIIIEAAVILPFFLLAVLSLATLIRIAGVEESLMNAYADEAVSVAEKAYIDIVPAGSEITRKIKSVGQGPAVNIHLSDFNCMYESRGIDGLISGDLCCEAVIPLPLNFMRVLEIEERLLYRAFIGTECSGLPMGFDRMEDRGETETVYVFPRAGERFHDFDCSYIAVCSTVTILSERIKKEFSPCKICRPEVLPLGSKVYCFYKAGKAYHRGSCPSVDRYVIPMERDDAIAKGYTPCRKCKGSGR